MPLSDEQLGALQELQKRGALNVEQQGAYQELQRRGVIPGGPPKMEAADTGLAATGRGFMQGLGDMLYGGAQIGARMGPEEGGAAFANPADLQRRQQVVDQATRQREGAYEQATRNHPYLAGLGRVGGNIGATAPLAAVPGVAGAVAAPTSLMGRGLMGTALGATQGAVMPSTGADLGTERLKGAGMGAVGGALGSAAGEVLGSTLGKAIAGNAPQAVEQYLRDTFRRVIKPSGAGRWREPQLTTQDRQIVTSFDDIIKNKNSLQVTSPLGEELPRGTKPQSIRQLADAIDQRMRAVFNEYDSKAAASGEKGIQVGLLPAANEAERIASEFGMKNVPGARAIRNDLLEFAGNMKRELFATPTQTQDLIRTLNQRIAPDLHSHGFSPFGTIAKSLRDSLDTAVTATEGPGYQVLKNLYGSLRSIQKDVGMAAAREANKITGGMVGTFLDAGAAIDFMHGIMHFSPEMMVKAGTMRAAKKAVAYLNNPNRAIQRMISRREAALEAPPARWRGPVGMGIQSIAPPLGGLAGGQATTPDPSRSLRVSPAF